jgi:hypothetical protein
VSCLFYFQHANPFGVAVLAASVRVWAFIARRAESSVYIFIVVELGAQRVVA